jgi:hypothetical protein
MGTRTATTSEGRLGLSVRFAVRAVADVPAQKQAGGHFPAPFARGSVSEPWQGKAPTDLGCVLRVGVLAAGCRPVLVSLSWGPVRHGPAPCICVCQSAGTHTNSIIGYGSHLPVMTLLSSV